MIQYQHKYHLLNLTVVTFLRAAKVPFGFVGLLWLLNFSSKWSLLTFRFYLFGYWQWIPLLLLTLCFEPLDYRYLINSSNKWVFLCTDFYFVSFSPLDLRELISSIIFPKLFSRFISLNLWGWVGSLGAMKCFKISYWYLSVVNFTFSSAYMTIWPLYTIKSSSLKKSFK